MAIYYSATTRGFYEAATHGEPGAGGMIPSDAREISEELHAELLAGQAAGNRIVPNAEGYPVLADLPIETQPEALARALVEIRKQRASVLATLDGIAGRYSRAGDSVTASAADAAIVALLDITKLPELLQSGTYEDMKAAVLTRYRQIAAAAPFVVQSAFIEAAAP